MVRAFVLASIAVVLIWLGAVPPSLAQPTAVDARWGLFAELAERDFHFEGWAGSKSLLSFRWEKPGQEMSVLFAYVGSQENLMILDPATGEIVVTDPKTYEKYGLKYGFRVKAAADGAIHFLKGQPYLTKVDDNKFEYQGTVWLPTDPGTPASEKVERMIAAGKLRAANPDGRGAPVASASTSPSAGVPGGTPQGSLPALGAPVELNQVQRDALDRYVKSVTTTFINGLNLTYSNWIEPGKSYVTHFLRESAGPLEGRYELRPDGLIVMSDEAQERANGLIGQINPSTGQITFDFRAGGKLNRTTVDGVAGQPGITQVVQYQGIQRKRGIEWAEVGRSSGAPYTPAQIEGTTRQINAQIQMRKNPWGALAALPGKLWYCVGYEPVQWLVRRRMYQGQIGFLDESVPVMRVTLATWREPNRVLEVVTKLGDGHAWTDTITLQPDGTFAMTSTGVAQYPNLRGHKDASGSVVFPIANYNYQNGIASNEIEFDASYPAGLPAPITMLNVKKDGYGNPTRCTMQPYEESKLQQWTAELNQEQQRSREHLIGLQQDRQQMAADEEEGQRMVANMRSELIGTILSGGGSGSVAYSPSTSVAGGGQGAGFLQDLRAMADTAHREAERSRAQLDATIAQAQASGRGADASSRVTASANPSGNAVSSSVNAAQSPAQARSSPPLSKRTLRALFEVQLVQRDDDDHNPVCQSTVMSFTIDWDSNDPNGNFQRENAALDPLVPTFISKCEATRKTFQQADYYVDDGSRPLQPKAIRHGDVEVVMP